MARALNPARKEKLMATALALFASQGVQNTSTAEIAHAAGVAAGTLFLYFPTKLDLIHGLVLRISQDQSEAINRALDPAFTARETFLAIWTGSLRWFQDHLNAYLYIQQVRDSGWIAAEVVEQSNQFLGYYYQAIEKGLAEGSIQPYPVELIGGILYQNIIAVMNLLRAQPDTARSAVYISTGFDIFWNGIRRPLAGVEEARAAR